jgi:hypothetical protein
VGKAKGRANARPMACPPSSHQNRLRFMVGTARRRAFAHPTILLQVSDKRRQKIFSHSLSPSPKVDLLSLMSCPVRGASRGDPEVGQSESWPEGQPEGRCGARGHASQAWTRGALGNRPCPLRGAAFSGWTGQVKGGRKPAWMASLLAPAPGRTVPGTKKSPRWSVRKALLLLPRRVVRRSISPQKGEIN